MGYDAGRALLSPPAPGTAYHEGRAQLSPRAQPPAAVPTPIHPRSDATASPGAAAGSTPTPAAADPPVAVPMNDSHANELAAGAAGLGRAQSVGRGILGAASLGNAPDPSQTRAEQQAGQAGAVSDVAGGLNEVAAMAGAPRALQQAGSVATSVIGAGAAVFQARAGIDQVRHGRRAEGAQTLLGAGSGGAGNVATLAEAAGRPGAGRVLNAGARVLDAGAGLVGVGRGIQRATHGDAEGGTLDTIDSALQVAGAAGGVPGRMVTDTARASLALGRRGDEEARRQGIYRTRRVTRGVGGHGVDVNQSASDAAAERADQVRRRHGNVAGAAALGAYAVEGSVVAGALGTQAAIRDAANFGIDTSDIEARDRLERGEVPPPEAADARVPQAERRVRAQMRRLAARREQEHSQQQAAAASAAPMGRDAAADSRRASTASREALFTPLNGPTNTQVTAGGQVIRRRPGEVGVQIDLDEE